MRRHGALDLLRDLGGAVVLGVATIFVPKARPDEHWSISPKIEVIVEERAQGAGPPGRPRRIQRNRLPTTA